MQTKPGAIRRLYNLLFGDIADILHEMVGELAPMGRLFFRFGIVFAVLSAWMAWQFGLQVSVQHAIGLAAVALMVAFAPHAAHYLWSVKGEKGAAVAAVVGTLLFGAIELTTHLGYTSSSRAMNTGEAKVQNATYGDARASVDTLQQRVDGFEARRKELDETLGKLTKIKVGEWGVTTKPSSSAELDGAIRAKKLEVDNESKRGGCKSKCEARTNELAHLEKLRAAALAIEQNHADHERTLGALAQAKNEAAGTEFKHSAVANSTAFVGNIVRVFSGAEKVSPIVQERAELVWTVLQSVGFSLAAMFALWMAGRFRLDRKPGEDPQHIGDHSFGDGLLEKFYANVNRHLPNGVAPFPT